MTRSRRTSWSPSRGTDDRRRRRPPCARAIGPRGMTRCPHDVHRARTPRAPTRPARRAHGPTLPMTRAACSAPALRPVSAKLIRPATSRQHRLRLLPAPPGRRDRRRGPHRVVVARPDRPDPAADHRPEPRPHPRRVPPSATTTGGRSSTIASGSCSARWGRSLRPGAVGEDRRGPRGSEVRARQALREHRRGGRTGAAARPARDEAERLRTLLAERGIEIMAAL